MQAGGVKSQIAGLQNITVRQRGQVAPHLGGRGTQRAIRRDSAGGRRTGPHIERGAWVPVLILNDLVQDGAAEQIALTGGDHRCAIDQIDRIGEAAPGATGVEIHDGTCRTRACDGGPGCAGQARVERRFRGCKAVIGRNIARGGRSRIRGDERQPVGRAGGQIGLREGRARVRGHRHAQQADDRRGHPPQRQVPGCPPRDDDRFRQLPTVPNVACGRKRRSGQQYIAKSKHNTVPQPRFR